MVRNLLLILLVASSGGRALGETMAPPGATPPQGTAIPLGTAVPPTPTLVPTPALRPSPAFPADYWRSVERILGRPASFAGSSAGEVSSNGEWILRFPRYDLNLLIEGTALEPEMVESVFSFLPRPEGVGLEASLMLLDREVPQALQGLLEEGFEVTGMQGPFWNASPGVKELRLTGKGSRERLAEALKRALQGTGVLKGGSGGSKGVSPLVQEAFGEGWKEGSTLRYFRGGGGIEGSITFQGEGERLAAGGTWILPVAESARVLKVFTAAGIRTAQIRREGGRVFLRFWYSGPPKGALAALAKEWARLSPPSPPPGP